MTSRTDQMTVEAAPLLSERECARARDQVFALRHEWSQRSPEFPFYILGTTSSHDAKDLGFRAYQENALRSNELLIEHFGWLHERVAEVLTEVHGTKCVYDDRSLARPGFNIFLSHPHWKKGGGIHCDLQSEFMEWPADAEIDFRRQFSFTLPLSLPAAGAGLDVWDLDCADLRDLSDDEREQVFLANAAPRHHRYEAGTLVVHSGLHLHQIAPMLDMRPDDERVTMQGFAQLVADRWILYW